MFKFRKIIQNILCFWGRKFPFMNQGLHQLELNAYFSDYFTQFKCKNCGQKYIYNNVKICLPWNDGFTEHVRKFYPDHEYLSRKE